ncbi:MAG: hypothetical protein ACK4SS_09215, partial [Cypionkella sp.]
VGDRAGGAENAAGLRVILVGSLAAAGYSLLAQFKLLAAEAGPEGARDLAPDLVTELRGRLNGATAGRRPEEAAGALAALPQQFRPEDAGAVSAVVAALRAYLAKSAS